MSVPEHPPQAVIKAALMHPVPCKTCGNVMHNPADMDTPHDQGDVDYRLDWTAQLIVDALTEHGHLASSTDQEPAPIEDVAKWLAEQSGHARYLYGDTWKTLLDPATENNVHHAHAAALEVHKHPGRGYEADLAAARDALLAHIAARRAAGNRG